jgi:hypothetical protein
MVRLVKKLSAISIRLSAGEELLAVLPDGDKTHMTFVSEHQRQAKLPVLGADLPGNTTECALCWRDEIIFSAMSVTVLHDACSID